MELGSSHEPLREVLASDSILSAGKSECIIHLNEMVVVYELLNRNSIQVVSQW